MWQTTNSTFAERSAAPRQGHQGAIFGAGSVEYATASAVVIAGSPVDAWDFREDSVALAESHLLSGARFLFRYDIEMHFN